MADSCGHAVPCDPAVVHGNLVPRIQLTRADGQPRFMLAAGRIWALQLRDPAAEAARFVPSHPDAVVFYGTAELGRPVLARAGGPGLALYVDVDLLTEVLEDAQGVIAPMLGPFGSAELKELREQVRRAHPAAYTRLRTEQQLECLGGAPAGEAEARPDELAAGLPGGRTCEQLPTRDRRVLQTMLVGLVLLLIGAMAVLVAVWLHMAQGAIEEPGRNYMLVSNLRGEALIQNVLSPAREATDIVESTGGACKEVPGLDTAYEVDGLTTSAVLTNKTRAEALVKYIVALMRTYPSVVYLGAGFADGSHYAVTRDRIVYIRDMQDLFGVGDCLMTWDLSPVDYALVEGSAKMFSCDFDPRDRPWYRITTSTRSKGWGGGVYNDFDTGKPIVSATAPLFEDSDSRDGAVLGVLVADFPLDVISSYLENDLQVGVSGVEYLYGADQKLVAGPGDLSVLMPDGTLRQRYVNESTDAIVRESNSYLISQIGDDIWSSAYQPIDELWSGDDQIPPASGSAHYVSFVGNALHDTPMQMTTSYKDYELEWLLTTMVPASDYYGFIRSTNFYATVSSFSAVAVISSALILTSLFLEYDEVGLATARSRTKQALLFALVACTAVYFVWLTTTKQGVDTMAVECMNEVAQYLQLVGSYRFEALVRCNNATANLYRAGAVDLSSGLRVESTTLDAHFISLFEIAKRHGQTQALFVGFEDTGNLIGAASAASVHGNSSETLVMVRAKSTGGALVYYEVDYSGSVPKRDINKEVARYESYDCRNRPWYTIGKAAGTSASVSDGYIFDGTKNLQNSIMLAYANPDDSSQIQGVLAAELDFEWDDALLAALASYFPEGSDFLILQNLGEMLASKGGQSIFENSAGVLQLVNATTLGTMAGQRASELLEDNGGLIESQGTLETKTSDKVSLISSAGLESPYISQEITEARSDWSILEVVPKAAYYAEYDEGGSSAFDTLLILFSLLFFYYSRLFRYFCTLVAPPAHLYRPPEFEQVDTNKDGVVDHEELKQLEQIGESKEPNSPPIGMSDRVSIAMNPLSTGKLSEADTIELPEAQMCNGGCHNARQQFDADSADTVVFKAEEPAPASDEGFGVCSLGGARSTYAQLIKSFLSMWTIKSSDPLRCGKKVLEEVTHARMINVVRNLDTDASVEGCSTLKRRNIAIEYLLETETDKPVFDTAAIEGRLGQSHWQTRIYKVWSNPWNRSIMRYVVLLFMLVEVLPEGIQFELELFLGIVTSIHIALRLLVDHAASNSIRQPSAVMCVAVILWWICFAIFPDASGLLKAFIYLATISELRVALELFLWAIMASAYVLLLFSAVLALTAIMMLLLFHSRYEPSTEIGRGADNFLDTLVAMMCFLTSVDNWEQIVDPMYEQFKGSAVFFAIAAVLGMIFLSSMVLAVFQQTFEMRKGEISAVEKRRQDASLCCSFVLWTWNQNENEFPGRGLMKRSDFIELVSLYWRKQSEPALQSTSFGPNSESARAMDVFALSQSHRRESNFQAILAQTLFEVLDEDGSGDIDADEFGMIFRISSVLTMIQADKLLGWRTITARWEILREEAQRDKKALSPGQLAGVEFMLANAYQSLKECRDEEKHKRRILGFLLWQSLDKMMGLVFLLHGFVLSLYSSNLIDDDVIFNVSASLCFLYAVEISLRVHSLGGITGFICDALYPHSSWSNTSQLCLVLLSSGAAIAYWTTWGQGHAAVLQAVMSAVLWRIFFTHPGFICLLYQLSHGLRITVVYFKLFLVVQYVFSFVAWRLLADSEYAQLADSAMTFDTLGDSIFTLFSIFIGADWVFMMQAAVNATNQAALWGFAAYVVIVAMLFLNLFVGLIITVFQEAHDKAETTCGQCELIFYWQLAGMSENKKKFFLKKLGLVASLLYAPAMKDTSGICVLTHKCRQSIEAYGGNIEIWAALKIQAAFKARRAYKLTRALAELRVKLDSIHLLSFGNLYKLAETVWQENARSGQPSAEDAGQLSTALASAIALSCSGYTGPLKLARLGHVPSNKWDIFDETGSEFRWGFHAFLCWSVPQVLSLLASTKLDNEQRNHQDREDHPPRFVVSNPARHHAVISKPDTILDV